MKAKLTQKGGKYLPTASVMKLMPAGTGGLSAVPTLERYLQISSGNREMAIQQYSTAISGAWFGWVCRGDLYVVHVVRTLYINH